MLDHVHTLISIPPKYGVARVIGFIKGKSAIHIAHTFMDRKRSFVGQHFWARGYFVSTVGRDEAVIRLIHLQPGGGREARRAAQPPQVGGAHAEGTTVPVQGDKETPATVTLVGDWPESLPGATGVQPSVGVQIQAGVAF